MRAWVSRAQRVSQGGPDAGLSMVELIVSMMVTAVVMTIVGTMFVNVARITTNSNASTSRSGIASNIVNELAKVIRPATNNSVTGNTAADPAVVSGTASALTLYALVDSSPTALTPYKVGFRIDSQGNVVEDRWTASLSQGFWVFTGTVASRIIGGPLQTTAGTAPLFVYLDETNAVITPGADGLTLAQRGLVASIQITVTVTNQPSTGSDPIVIVNTVGMPNLQLSRTDN